MNKILRYLRPYWIPVTLAVLLVMLQSVAELWLPRLMATLVDQGVAKQDLRLIFHLGGQMLLVTLAGGAAAIAAAWCAAKAAMGLGRDLRLAAFTRVEGFSQAEFDTLGTSTLITRTTQDVTQLQNFFLMGMHMLVRSPSMMIVSLVMALSLDRKLTMVLLMALPFLFGIVALIAVVGLPLFRKMQDKVDALNRVLREQLSGIRVIRAFNRTGTERARYDRANRDLTGTALKAQRLMMMMSPLMMLVMNLSTVAVVWFGSVGVASGDLQVGSLMAFIQYAFHILFSLMIISAMFVMLPRAQVSADRVAEVLATESSIRNGIALPTPPLRRAGAEIEFRSVSFKYPGAEEWALRDLSFRVQSGQTVAVIGGTGSGKTTLLSLILRFYDVTGGAILVDGLDVRFWPLDELRSRLALVPQKTVLFSGSIASNLRFGKEAASEGDLDEALRIAQAKEFVDRTEKGLFHDLSQGGTNLSGGQRQRVSIARALSRKAELYLFDDSFSALDFKTDAALRRELRTSLSGSSALIVAQRVGTVMGADSILVLDEGRVAGMGTHRELLESCPIYREIVASQFQGEEAV